MAILTETPSNPYWRPLTRCKTQPYSNMPIPWIGYPYDDQETLMAHYRQDLSLRAKRQRWRMLWHNGPMALACHLRTKYKLNFKAYMRSFQPSDEDLMRDVENHFADFVKTETRLLRRSRQVSVGRAGKAAVESFMEAIADDGMLTEETDFVLMSIDFEGQHGFRTGIKEFGLAMLDTRRCLGPTGCQPSTGQSIIRSLSYARTHSASRQFQYGTTTKMDVDLLAELITRSVMIQDIDEQHGTRRLRKVIMVGQSVRAELDNLESLGLDIGQLGVIGTMDTWDLARSTFGASLRLKHIMERLEMPQREHSYHTAGNDAYFALQAMLAMLVRRHRKDAVTMERLDWLDQVARKVNVRPQYMDKGAEGHWEDCLGGEYFNALALS